MSRSTLFRDVMRTFDLAREFEASGVSTSEGLERLGERRTSRRELLVGAGAAALALSPAGAIARRWSSPPRIAIVGGGLSGLVCADRLQSKGVRATIFEASSRLGGRCFSNRSLVPGMAAENGGEFIDTGHKTMLAYANEFGLARETVTHQVGEERFYFFGRQWTESQVVDEFREVVARMQPDLRAISGSAGFRSNNQADIDFDHTDLASYFASRCSGFPLLEAVLNEAYLAEYGLETSEQSTLNFLGFMRLNKQSKFEPFGVSDERYHLVRGNDGIVQGLAAKLTSPIYTGARLTRLGRNAVGEYLLYFNGSSVPERADAVILTLPFTVLRTIQLDASLGLSADKIRAIQTLGYGTNAKTMVAFGGRPWASRYGANGGCYSDLANVQNTWETNRINAGARAVLTDYASGVRGAQLRTNRVQNQVSGFLADLDLVFPGVRAAATRSGASWVAHLEHWPSNPLSLGSYTCYKPGQFTGIEGLNGEAAGLLKFGGEHADSFYSWQGYMEGACLSGIRTADEVLADIRAGRL
ncbi:MAG TPA: FAD-dependent oxidoreductase [Fimbriimonadaceae bacterium]|nr:FAD-dependent oxidoreductase [Fimbriimonadaceae bacterium]